MGNSNKGIDAKNSNVVTTILVWETLYRRQLAKAQFSETSELYQVTIDGEHWDSSERCRREDPKAFIKEKEDEYTKLFANPYNAAKYGYIDDVIEPRNTRFRVIRALQMLATKKDTNPPKKHGNIPL